MDIKSPQNAKCGSKWTGKSKKIRKSSSSIISQVSSEKFDDPPKLKEERLGDAENVSGKKKRGKKKRRSLAGVNYLTVSGPVNMIDRPPTPIKASSFFRASQPVRQKCLNPFAQARKNFPEVSEIPPKLQKSSSSILCKLLTPIKQKSERSQWRTLDEIEILEDESNDCIEILYGQQTLDPPNRRLSHDKNNNSRKMPKLKGDIPDQEMISAHSHQTIDECKNAKPRMREEKIYHEENFSVQNFLERSNNPRDYFCYPNRICTRNSTLIEFLLNSFLNVNKKEIERIYAIANYNVSNAAFALNQLRSKRVQPRNNYVIEAESITQLQEMKFLQKYILVKENSKLSAS